MWKTTPPCRSIGSGNAFTTTVKTTIGRLRAKLGDPPLIETVREGGYRI
jgi:DNA-binding response OmpR family regulator